MRFLIALLVCLFVACAVSARADTTVVARRGSVISAQDHAVVIARRGSLVHSSCGQTEGIGSGPSPSAARQSCCFFKDAMAGRRVIVDEGVAYSPVARRWFAVIRYR
jgi:hypothetical protein